MVFIQFYFVYIFIFRLTVTVFQVHPEDNLPKMVCKQCVRMIKKFYTFKQTCIKVNEELKLKLQNNYNSKLELSSSVDNLCDLNFDPLDTTKDQNKVIINNSITTIQTVEELKNDLILAMEQDTVCKTVESNILGKKDHLLNITLDENNIEGPDILQCEQCGSLFQTNQEFKSHLSTHNNTKLYQCIYCPKQFTRAETQRIHTRSHLGIKPYMCEICGRPSTKRQDLIRHMKIHSDDRNYKCDTCGRCFKRSADLITHMRTHTGARPYKCYLCEKDYTSHSGLKKHYKMHFKKELDL